MTRWLARRLAWRALSGAMREVPGHPPAPTTVSAGEVASLVIHGVAGLLLGLAELFLLAVAFAAIAMFVWKLVAP